ncbi:MAG: Asp-tRNA(Asn)/Glu-tRNA(Gln) amidotransferase subunit GatC [Alphaproteobacteria bacterium]|nr:Asp-tRNA(Asn)/Glu-tRNA(Gln) amidotransferase subunit GatC [Alphaproteobacteria bacterium]
MAIDTQTVKRIAFLARLKIDDDKIEAAKDEFNKIIDWVEQLNEVDTENVRPLTAVNETKLFCRKDEVKEGNQSDKILYNAPAAEYDYFVVPKVVE